MDFASNARSLGAHVIEAGDLPSLHVALGEAKAQTGTTVVVIETDPEQRVPGYESWWDVPVAEVSEMKSVGEARKRYEQAISRERHLL